MHMRIHGWRAGEVEKNDNGGEENRRERRRHMLTVPPRASPILAAFTHSHTSPPSSPNYGSFVLKDGRKVSVGDCALFKPPQDSPPFIGIIRSVTTCIDNKLSLSVNWLYRPSEVKLGKGSTLEAAPNEIFYSFHKDEIPAASLLHPCKVAFLPKGVELPPGIGSFVCRKIYDISKKCLWWLTDQDFINEIQEEVNQLLDKTRIEMNTAAASGGRSPKSTNGPTSTSQFKPSSDSLQNNASFPSQVKGKKRDRGDQVCEPVKRERISKIEDGDTGHCRTENSLKSEIAKFSEKGGLVDFEGVEKLVQLMVPDRNEKKLDLVCRSMLAGVVAGTDKVDCLNRFVQLKGLPVFDEWLQDVHKGKIGDSSSPRDGDKSVEEFLLILLRALDKLHVNLHALQMCNIGKSVNHLRTHKNLDIQKKARSLVDTWKKRVEAEMDAKSGGSQAVSWPARTRLSDHSGNRQTSGSSEVAVKSLVTQPSASKAASVKLVHGQTATKSAFASPLSMKSAPSVTTNTKDGQPRSTTGAASDIPSTPAKDEKSSSSSQSHNNSQSCSSDHTKAGVFSGKEDARSSTAVSMTTCKTSGSSSRSKKSANGFPGSAAGGQRESGSSKNSSLQRNQSSERLAQGQAQSTSASEKTPDGPVAEGSNPKLIVKISSRSHSPAQNVNGASFEDPSVTISRTSSPVLSDRQDQSDHISKDKGDAFRTNVSPNVNNDSSQNNGFRDAGSDEGDGSSAHFPCEKGFRTGVDSRKVLENSKDVSVPSGKDIKTVKYHESSLSVLIESCAKYSEADASLPARDDNGMNLLASVAAGEMSKSEILSPTSSPRRDTNANDHSCDDNGSKVKSSPLGEFSQVKIEPTGVTDSDLDRASMDRKLLAKNANIKQEKPSGDHSPKDLQHSVDPRLESDGNSEGKMTGKEAAEDAGKHLEGKLRGRVEADGKPDVKQNTSGSLLTEDRVSESDVKVEIGTFDGSSLNQSSETGVGDKKIMNEGFSSIPLTDYSSSPVSIKGSGGLMVLPSGVGIDKSENINAKKSEIKEADVNSHNYHGEKQKIEGRSYSAVPPSSGVSSGNDVQMMEDKLEAGDSKVLQENSEANDIKVQESEQTKRHSERNEAEKSDSTKVNAAAAVLDVETKVVFDLNEGFTGDDGKYGELTSPLCSTAVQQLISPLPFSVSSVSSPLVSITVAAAAKGPFVPPQDLLKSKGVLGWKGSAATSAFRPAEPRKILEMSLVPSDPISSDATPEHQSRLALDIDLNVPDERIYEDLASRSAAQDAVSISSSTNNGDNTHCELTPAVCSSGSLDLDLNRVEGHKEIGNYSASNGHRIDVPFKPITSAVGLFNGQVSVRRDFDLNDGPVVDEMSAEPLLFTQHSRSVTSQPHVSSLRMNTADSANISSFFPRGKTRAVSSALSERGEHPFPIVASGGLPRMLSPSPGGSPFGPDVYRGSVLSSSPAMPFQSTPFQYPVFPFGTSFLPSATFSGGPAAYMDSSSGGRICFPAVNSQLIGPASALPSHFPRPYVVSLPDGSSNNPSADSSWKWGRQGLDLNAGPGVPDVEGRDETSPLVPRQLPIANPQPLSEEQVRMYHMSSGILKRKEPEGGWDGYKRPSWQ